MAHLTRTLEQNNVAVGAVLAVALALLLVFSPAEASLGNAVKIVYAHGAAERVSSYAFLVAGALGLVQFVHYQASSMASRRQKRSQPGVPTSRLFFESTDNARVLSRVKLARWTRAIAETAILFWVAQFLISLPAQVLAWGGLTFTEPRVAEAIWILGLTLLVYAVALWIDEPEWMALAAVANAIIVVIVLHGSMNVLHPLNPIVESDSIAIKAFYAAIVLVTGALAIQTARVRAAMIGE